MWFCFGFLIAGTGLQRKLNLPSMSYWTLKPELLDKDVISSLEATEHWERWASIMQSGRGESLREKKLAAQRDFRKSWELQGYKTQAAAGILERDFLGNQGATCRVSCSARSSFIAGWKTMRRV